MEDDDLQSAYIDRQMREPLSVRPATPRRPATTSEDWRPRESRGCQNSRGTRAITQGMLAEFKQLRLKSQECERMRAEILRLLDSGAIAEDGDLDLRVEIREEYRLTNAVLTVALGAAKVTEMKAAAAPTVIRVVKVTDRSEQGDS